jgi:hypothetical protein
MHGVYSVRRNLLISAHSTTLREVNQNYLFVHLELFTDFIVLSDQLPDYFIKILFWIIPKGFHVQVAEIKFFQKIIKVHVDLHDLSVKLEGQFILPDSRFWQSNITLNGRIDRRSVEYDKNSIFS